MLLKKETVTIIQIITKHLNYIWTESKELFCALWYHLYNLENVKNTHGGMLKVKLLHECFSRFFKLYKWYQIAQRISYDESAVRFLVWVKNKCHFKILKVFSKQSHSTCTSTSDVVLKQVFLKLKKYNRTVFH